MMDSCSSTLKVITPAGRIDYSHSRPAAEAVSAPRTLHYSPSNRAALGNTAWPLGDMPTEGANR